MVESQRVLLKKLLQYLGLQKHQSNIYNGCTKFQNQKLLWLDLGYIDLKALPEEIFSGFTDLEYLGLYGNDLTALPDKIFEPLVGLKYLDLGNNKLAKLNSSLFRTLKSLRKLWLYGNKFTDFPPQFFESLNLDELNLNSNPIKKFNPKWIMNMFNLRRIEIINTHIKEMSNSSYKHLPHLRELIFNTENSLFRNLANQTYNLDIENRIDHFCLVTGLMGAGKSTLMAQNSVLKVKPNYPKKKIKLFFDTTFGCRLPNTSDVLNYFELDAPTIKTWTEYIRIADIIILVINATLITSQKEEFRTLINLILKEKQKNSYKLIITLNRYSGKNPRLELENLKLDIDLSKIPITCVSPGKMVPSVNGSLLPFVNENEINRIFTKSVEMIR